MKRILLAFLALLLTLTGIGQHALSRSRQGSEYTYIYRVNAKEARELYAKGLMKLPDSYLHTLVDSFKTNSPFPKTIQNGNYLVVYANKNRLRAELKSIDSLYYRVFNDNNWMGLLFFNENGEPVKDVKVRANGRSLRFDDRYQLFRWRSSKREIKLSVEHNGIYQELNRPEISTRRNYRNFWQRLKYASPLKHVILPIERWFLQKRNRYYDFYDGPTRYERNYRGFMVFNQPKFKPGDTVHLKAFIQTAKAKPVNRPLIVRLVSRGYSVDSVLGFVKPYAPGGFTFDFVLNEDSLDLDLDEEYLITLEEPESKKYDVDTYSDDLDDEEITAKRKVLMRGKFEYEEYELSLIKFTATADKPAHNKGNPLKISYKAVDENQLPILDGKVSVQIKTNQGQRASFDGESVFIPDILWKHEFTLDQSGEYQLLLPDSIFPNATFSYTIENNLTTSDNRFESVNLFQEYSRSLYSISFIQQQDSVLITANIGTKEMSVPATVIQEGNTGNILMQSSIQLPARLPVNPLVKKMVVRTADCEEDYFLGEESGISCITYRDLDSIKVQVINPAGYFFWYTLFAGKKVIERGYANQFSYNQRLVTRQHYFFRMQYLSGGSLLSKDLYIGNRDKMLDLAVSHPDYIYPGQEVPVELSVSKLNGKPMADADVTAYGVTARFESQAPFVPYLGKNYPGLKRKFLPALARISNSILPVQESRLNWARWSKEMGLDSIEYYRFTHTESVKTQVEPSPDSLTQLAPFVIRNGDILPLIQLYIDETPVYFNQSSNLKRYSFSVMSGRHALKLRTDSLLISLDSVFVQKGQKTFIAINADTLTNKRIKVVKMPDTLTNYEKMLWSRYMILLDNNYRNRISYLKGANDLQVLNDETGGQVALLGPFTRYGAKLVVKDVFTQDFEPEGGYLFTIRQGLIKQRQWQPGSVPFRKKLTAAEEEADFGDFVLTEKQVDSLWNEFLDHHPAISNALTVSSLNSKGNGKLVFELPFSSKVRDTYVKNIFLFREDDPDFLRVYAGLVRDLGYLNEGVYRMLVLGTKGRYVLFNSIRVRIDGVNCYRFTVDNWKSGDSVSQQINNIINQFSGQTYIDRQGSDQIKSNFNNSYVDASLFSHLITGRVTQKNTEVPVVSATVLVKGTRQGTTTDRNGYFSLYCPPRGTLQVTSVGYEMEERRFTEETYQLDIKLLLSSNSLNEVVVTGYGVVRKKEMTASIAMISSNELSGKVAGLSISVRGISTLKKEAQPLILLNGVPFSGDLSTLDTSKISSIVVLKDPKSLALYGNPAGGVILISTEFQLNTVPAGENDEMMSASQSLRSHFRDYAFWQPRLRTDEHGKVKFTINYPDDITNWQNYFIAIKGRYTGMAQKSVKSFKTVSANVPLPMFVTVGDSINLLGKTFNYNADSIILRRTFSVNGLVRKQETASVGKTLIDTVATIISERDSLEVQYEIQKGDGYYDGERRSIPVIRQGVKETKGFFAMLDRDTVIRFTTDQSLGEVKIYAENSLLPVLENEIEHIRDYEYLCNEQMASKLKALLLKKKIFARQKRKFEEEKNILFLINSLNRNSNQQGLYGWWGNSGSVYWISMHVCEALLMAQEMGYQVMLKKQLIIDQGVAELGRPFSLDHINWIRLLYRLGANVNFDQYLDTVNAHRLAGFTDSLENVLLNFQLGRTPNLDFIRVKQQNTVFGNSYWGEKTYLPYYSITRQTLLVYQIYKLAGSHETDLKKIRYYFLEQRRSGSWENTYESSLILETILPDILTVHSEQPARLQWNDGTTITSFPYQATVKPGEALQLSKSGGGPVYFTAFQESWNPRPAPVEGNFIVHSSFAGKQLNGWLTAGEKVTLNVEVVVKADADYVMIEIPVPAACSYLNKEQSWKNNEVHREYFRNKVSLFCSKLTPGRYTFSVDLMPRFTGKYILNPAKAEMMYYPVFFGREGMKTVEVR